jgi:hypothetical protein
MRNVDEQVKSKSSTVICHRGMMSNFPRLSSFDRETERELWEK